MDFNTVLEIVLGIGAFGATLIVFISILLLLFMKTKKTNNSLDNFQFDEFYDASDNISFEKMQESRVWQTNQKVKEE